MREFARVLLGAACLGAALMAGDQVIQLFGTLLGSGLGEPAWRFQLATLMVGRQVPLLFGLLILAWAGWVAGVQNVVRAMAWAAWGLAGLLGVAVVVLWADGPAARSVLLADELMAFTVQWIRVLVAGGAGVLGFGVIGLGLGRTFR